MLQVLSPFPAERDHRYLPKFQLNKYYHFSMLGWPRNTRPKRPFNTLSTIAYTIISLGWSSQGPLTLVVCCFYAWSLPLLQCTNLPRIIFSQDLHGETSRAQEIDLDHTPGFPTFRAFRNSTLLSIFCLSASFHSFFVMAHGHLHLSALCLCFLSR